MKRTVLSVISLIFSFVILLTMTGFTVQTGSTALTGAVSQNAQVLLFENYDDTALFAYTDVDTHILSADGTRSCTTAYPAAHAFLCGSTVKAVCELYDFLGVQCFNADTLTETDFYSVQISLSDTRFLEADNAGCFYAVLFSDPGTVAVYDTVGSYIGSLHYSEDVQGIQVLGSTLYVFLRSQCDRIALNGGLPQSSGNTFAYSAPAHPFRMLDSSTYISVAGSICTTAGQELLDAAQHTFDKKLLAADSGMFYWTLADSMVFQLDSVDYTQASLQLSGTVEAISDTAAVVRKNNVFCFEIYDAFTPTATPVPAPTASPAPAGSSNPSISIVSSYLYAPAGTTAAKLRTAFADSDVQVCNASMQSTSGKLRTGWIVMIGDELYTVVIPGDVNSSGTVNTADLRLLQTFLAGDETPTDAERLAADLSQNGTVDAADLVLLIAVIA